MGADGSAGPALRPLTEAQEGLWYFQALDPSNPILNTGQYLELSAPVDLPALREALTRALAETEALQLRFTATPDGPRQWVSGVLPPVTEMDLRDHPDAAAEALRWMQEDSGRPADLASGPVAAFAICLMPGGQVLLYERIHHLAIDGYGMVLLTNRIGEHYGHLTGQGPSPLPFPPLSRADEEDAVWRISDQRARDAAWWKAETARLPEVTSPGTLAGERAISGAMFHRESLWLPAPLTARLAEFSAVNGLAWPEVLTGLTAAYLARWSGGETVIGMPFMARMGRRIARLPCMAMNVLPLHLRPDEDALLADWLRAAAAKMREARRHGLYRSEQLRRDLGLVGGTRRLYGPLVNVQPFDRPPVFPGLEVRLHILGAGAVDDLTFTFRGDPQAGLLFETDANPALYPAAEVAAHSARLAAFLHAALAAGRLAEVPIASPADIAAQAALAAVAVHPLPKTTLVEMIAEKLAAQPGAPALTYGGTTLSRAEVDRRSAALAGALAARGAGPGKIVAVALERGLDLPVALLAAMRAGAAYLPLDPDHPPERLARILAMAQPLVLLTSADLLDRFPADAPAFLPGDWPMDGAAPATGPGPDDMAYVIYTSGSTGEPKGVVIEQRAIVNRLWWMRDHYRIGPGDRILQKTPATFDVSVWEFFLPFLSGAELVMAPPGAHRDPAALAGLIRHHAITTLHFVPSMLSAFLASPESEGLEIAHVFCSGEELTADLRDRFHTRIRGALHNLYGPTEAAVDVSFWEAGPDDRSSPLPIGWPVWNTRLEVLDDRMRPLPPGLPGRLFLGGVQLARGYLGRDDLTAARFVADPARPGERLYDTGDLARLRPDGAVVYLGRLDHQVKIRGLRIELGEIEAAIMATGLARECVVLAREDHAGEKRLVAYLVPADDHQPGALAARLAAVLPAYMVPAAEVVLPALPVTTNGKLDRKALPAPEFRASGRPADSAGERLLARLYAEVLHLDAPPPAEADFFGLGGDSLSAVRLGLRIAQETGHDPGLGAIFETPVLEHLAARLAARAAPTDGAGPVLLLAEGDPAAPPLFLIHPAGGLAWGYRGLARALGGARRVWGLQHPGLAADALLPGSLQVLAQDYAARVVGTAPDGPVHLAGWSVGGILVQAVAVELTAMGREAGLAALLDSYPAEAWRAEPEPDPVAALRALLAIAGHDPEAHRDLDTRAKVVAFLRAGDTAMGALPEALLDGVVRVVTDTNRLVRGHFHRRYPGRLTHIRAGLDHRDRALSAAMWAPHADSVEELAVPFLHPQMTSPAAVALIAPLLAQRMG